MREGMAGKAAVGKVALYGREYLVAIQPRENGLVMYTLRHASEVRSMGAIDELKTVPAKIKPDEVKLARQVIGNFETERRPHAVQGRLSGTSCARSSTRRSRARKSSRRRRRRRRRSSTSWTRCARASSASRRPRSGRRRSPRPKPRERRVGQCRRREEARPRVTPAAPARTSIRGRGCHQPHEPARPARPAPRVAGNPPVLSARPAVEKGLTARGSTAPRRSISATASARSTRSGSVGVPRCRSSRHPHDGLGTAPADAT